MGTAHKVKMQGNTHWQGSKFAKHSPEQLLPLEPPS
jgi:hypothetical protein